MTAGRNATASFAATAHHLTVSGPETFSGTVVSSPAGIRCRTDCDQDYAVGTRVTLTARPLGGHQFFGWSGAPGCDRATTCVVVMDQNRYVTADFRIP